MLLTPAGCLAQNQSCSAWKGVCCTLLQDVSDAEMDDDEAALAAAGAWEPDPVLADPTRSSRTRRMSDVIAALIGIYGSKELFITEYRCAGSGCAWLLSSTLLGRVWPAASNTACSQQVGTIGKGAARRTTFH